MACIKKEETLRGVVNLIMFSLPNRYIQRSTSEGSVHGTQLKQCSVPQERHPVTNKAETGHPILYIFISVDNSIICKYLL
jgi:hypothetical protein